MICADIGEAYGEFCKAVSNYKSVEEIEKKADILHNEIIAAFAKIREMKAQKQKGRKVDEHNK